MTEPHTNGFTKKVAIALARLGAVAMVGWNANQIVASKADASDVDKLQDGITRLEAKLDALLIIEGIDPNSIR